MLMTLCRSVFSSLVVALLTAGVAQAQPDEGASPSGVEEAEPFAALDALVEAHMEHIGATAATLAVSYRGDIVYSQAYGWSDPDGEVPTTTSTTFRLASNSKPITSAIVRQLIAERDDLDAGTRVLRYLRAKPLGRKLEDKRWRDITVGHLLTHKGGWDRSTTFDPTYRPKTISKAMKIDEEDLTPDHVVKYMLSFPLQYEPGTTRAYSNFGYLLLGAVIEKATKRAYREHVEALSDSLGADIRVSATDVDARHPSEVHYPRESGLEISLRESLGGLTASAESMCAFMDAYWIDGKPRRASARRWFYHFGRHRKSTSALMEQRRDGFDYAVMFNASRDEGSTKDTQSLRGQINGFVDALEAPR